MNSVEGPLDGTAKLFNFHDDAEMYISVVYTGEWDEEIVDGAVSLASSVRPDPADGVYVVSVIEPPEGVAYLTGAHPRGDFVLEVMDEVQNGPEFGPESAAHFAGGGWESLARHFGATVDVDNLDALEDLDEVVLAELRTVDDPGRPQDGTSPARRSCSSGRSAAGSCAGVSNATTAPTPNGPSTRASRAPASRWRSLPPAARG